MQRFDDAANEIKAQADTIRIRFLGEAEGENPVIFGAGNCGHKIYDLLQRYDVEIRGFCDNKMAGTIDELTGLAIMSPEDMYDTIENPVILVCVDNADARQAIRQQLLSLGFKKTQIHMMNAYFYWQTREYFEENIEKYKKAYQLMDDDFSKQVYLERMKKVFMLKDISEIVSPEEEYFDEKIVLTEAEVFIDCGGFDGDSAQKFVKRCGGKYRDLIIFEPEPCKMEAIEKNMGVNRYELYQSGVWSVNTKLHFSATGTDSSYISENGKLTIEAVALDETVYDKKPTYIKMDIEGAEQEALKGCKKIIQTYKPKLAICIYHKPEDLYEIPAMIKEMNPEYKLYVRQYANTWSETVLYAI